MPWAHPDVLDNGLAYLKANASRLLLITSYTNGDGYGAVVSRKLAEVGLASTDWTIANGTEGSRQVSSTAGKVASATASVPGPTAPATQIDLYFAFTDGVGKVLWVTAATSEQAIVSGVSYTFPSLTYTSAQPALS